MNTLCTLMKVQIQVLTTHCLDSLVLTGHVLRRLDLSNMTNHHPLVRGDNITRL